MRECATLPATRAEGHEGKWACGKGVCAGRGKEGGGLTHAPTAAFRARTLSSSRHQHTNPGANSSPVR
jgi:hypothetical protein